MFLTKDNLVLRTNGNLIIITLLLNLYFYYKENMQLEKFLKELIIVFLIYQNFAFLMVKKSAILSEELIKDT